MGGRYPALRTAADIERRIGRGCGQGRGAAYRPWFRVQEVPSIGRSHKVAGVKVGRTHHLLSDLESACLFALEYQRSVTDIREQFPLLPTDFTQATAARLGIRHPRYPGTATPQVLTTDFCVDVLCGEATKREVAIAVKYTSELGKQRVRELLAVECEANRALGRSWYLFTEQSLPSLVLRNLKWLRYGACFPTGGLTADTILSFRKAFIASHNNVLELSAVLNRTAHRLRTSADIAIHLFRFAGWHQVLPLSLTTLISPQRPLVLSEDPNELLDLAADFGTAEAVTT